MLLVVLLVLLLGGVGSGVESGVDGGQGGKPRCMQARGFRRVWAWLWADFGAEGVGVFGGVFGGGLGRVWGGQGSDVVMEFLSHVLALRRHPRSPTAQPNRKPRRIPAASGPREPPSKAYRATRRYDRTKIGSQNHHGGKSRTSAPVTRLFKPTSDFARC